MQKFGIGQAVRRLEDERFITGHGRYLDDLPFANLAHAVFVRSPFAHARIVDVDVAEARSADGVVAVFTAEDVKDAGLGPFPTLTAVAGVDENGIAVPPRYALTGDVARFVGDPIVMVVAETLDQARAASELVMIGYDDLPVATQLETVLDGDTPVIWPEIGSNRCYHFHKGDEAAVAEAIASAHHVTRLRLVNNRLSPSAIEPRGAVGDFEAGEDRMVLHVSGQAVHGQRAQMADAIFKVPADRIRVVMHDVGGGFGAKNFVYPENVMVMLAARRLGRPVKWIAERSENFITEIHGRDHVTDLALALDKEGRFTALEVKTTANMGAYLSSYATIIPTSASWVVLGGLYDIPALSMSVDAVFTNTVPVDAYRGAGRPEAAYLIERIVDVAAHDIGIEPLELRRRNFITTFPYRQALGMEIDCGDFPGMLDMAERAADVAGLAARKAASAKRGLLRGLGVGSYLEIVLGLPADDAEIRFEANGRVSLLVGGQSTGQGHHTAYAQVLASELGIDPEIVDYVQGDTALIKSGGGHGGSRTLMTVGSAVAGAAGEVRDKGLRAAAHVLDADDGEIDFADSLYRVRGTNRQISLLELEAALRQADGLPDGVPRSLSSKARWERKKYAYPNGVHVAEVEVDPDTGQVRLDRYAIVDDFGRILNPLIAAGQAMGGAVQGIGQAMLEGVVYDDSGQLLTGSFMDYAMPRAGDVPAIEVSFNEAIPTASNPLGVKGAGEAGATGAPPAVVNAVLDALKPLGIRHVDMPLTPERVWRAIRFAQ